MEGQDFVLYILPKTDDTFLQVTCLKEDTFSEYFSYSNGSPCEEMTLCVF